MMEPLLKEGHFIRHEGTLKGTAAGGLAAMYASLTAKLPCSDMDGAPGSGEEQAEPQTAPETPRSQPVAGSQAAAGKGKSGAEDLQEQVAILQQLVGSISEELGPDDSRLPLFAASVRQCNLEMQRIRARQHHHRATVPAIPLQPNGAAPAGMSRKRLKSNLESGRNRSNAPVGPPLSAESPEKPRAAPFHRPKAVKPLTMQEQVMGQTLRQGQKAEAAAVAVGEREARRAAKARKISVFTSIPVHDGNRPPARDSPASIAPSSMDAAAAMPSIPSGTRGKENTSAPGETPEPSSGLLPAWPCAAGQRASQATAVEHLDTSHQEPPFRRKRAASKWLSEFELE